MKVYLAGSCSSDNRTLMTSIAQIIRSFNIDCYCPFELKIPNAWDMSQEEWAKKVFDKDVEAIDNCDLMISISNGRKSTAGTNWEQGYAFANKKAIWVFQINNEDTSLMTYCGCDLFFNSTKETILKDIELVLSCGKAMPLLKKNNCKSTLT